MSTSTSELTHLSQSKETAREDFEGVPPGEIPPEGLQVGLIWISYGTPEANRVKIDLCEYDDNSHVVEKHVLQSVELHAPIDVRVDLPFPCQSVVFALFAFPRLTVETTARVFADDGAILREHIWLAGDDLNTLFGYEGSGEKRATYFTVTGGANLFLDNVLMTEWDDPATPELIVTNGDFENDDAWVFHGSSIWLPAPPSRRVGLSSGPLGDASIEQKIFLPVAGKYSLSFTLRHKTTTLEPDRGKVLIETYNRTHESAIEVKANGVYPISLVFDIPEDDIGVDQALRIVKLGSENTGLQSWEIDDVRMVALL
ncbi:hypothetical protein C8J98_10741 [Luteibacter sp. OK325]|uniref:hypothetical protein n=1 Tax=Luteibacter sp. OK325 TaxID=2135670 RepID=UPI000D403F62|nr:hypothetical protein [Luteibacter sp. OK325]PTR29910.1 hypothetical protein C8J98_10741 [Luteibacter sp. OK325]